MEGWIVIHIYVRDILELTIGVTIILILWSIFIWFAYKRERSRRNFKALCCILMIASVYGVLFYTVLGRSHSDGHVFVLAASYNEEFYREMFMNALLYYPFGLTLTVIIGPWSILAAFLLSALIESWQYYTGAGLSQGTDIIMNTLGAAIGAIPCVVTKLIWKKKESKRKKKWDIKT